MFDFVSFSTKFPEEVQSFFSKHIKQRENLQMVTEEVDSFLFQSDSTGDELYFYFDSLGYYFAFFPGGQDDLLDDLSIEYCFSEIVS